MDIIERRPAHRDYVVTEHNGNRTILTEEKVHQLWFMQ